MSASVTSRSTERDLGVGEACLRDAAQVQHDLDERGLVGQGMDRRHDLRRQRAEERIEVVDQLAGRMVCHSLPQRIAGTMAGSATRTRVSFIRSVTVATVVNPASSTRCSSGNS